jgi:hypothetical protein
MPPARLQNAFSNNEKKPTCDSNCLISYAISKPLFPLKWNLSPQTLSDLSIWSVNRMINDVINSWPRNLQKKNQRTFQ